MKSALLKAWGRLKKLSTGNGGKGKIRLTFLGLSLLLWFLIKLSKGGYVSTLDFSIDYSDLPEGMVFTESPPNALQIKLQGTGFDLIKYGWFNYKDLDVDLRSLETDRKGRSYWTSASAVNYLEAQLSDGGTRILAIHPDTVFFNISRLITKKIPLKLDLKYQFDTTTHVLYGEPWLSTDSIVVEAPAEALQQLPNISTQEIRIKEASDSLSLDVGIKVPELPHLKVQTESVSLKLEFSALTEGLIQVPILAINLPDTLKMELFPSQVGLTFRCALRDYKNIRPEEFLVYADFNQIKTEPDRRFLYLSLENPPSQVRKVQLQPKRVEYLLSKP